MESDNYKILLREEELSISKKWVKTGDVIVRKDVLHDEISLTVPVLREELIIEKKIRGDDIEDTSEKTETIRIPICEERVEVVKHPVLLADVTIYKQMQQNIQHIDVSLKKENVSWQIEGSEYIAVKEIEKT
ncbi:MAG TPA: YsnF/AvaK domain-containing protein [Pseudobacteroides sp.]|uniref:YsnF/AvaK domain-containing protein n=1 Tax=Pseudobacteroides sp. TaxID=1968840 RepID=UPI002F92B2DF